MIRPNIGMLTENWALKLAALVLAVMLWLAVTANQPERATFRNVPVEVDLRDPDWRLQRTEPEQVAITLQGPRGELMDLSADPPRIVLPVERVNDSIQTQVVPLQWIQLPSGVRETRVLRMRPDTILLHYQRLETRTVPVQVHIRGDLPEGYSLSLPLNTNPSSISVRGPTAVLARIDSVPLLPVDLSGLRSTTNIPVSVDTAAFELLTFDPVEVNVVLRVVPTDSIQADTTRSGDPS